MEANDDLRLAHRLADVGADIALAYFGRIVGQDIKDDGTPVTEADVAVERAMLKIISAERPGDAVLTEESGALSGTSGRRWLLDPIDGTIPFLAGKRSWGTHVALEVDGTLTVAVLTRPTEGRRWWGIRCGGAYASTSSAPLSTDHPLTVSATSCLREARIGGFVPEASAAAAEIAECAAWVDDEVSAIAALLEGRLDAVLDEGGHVWDMAPAALLTCEAGGCFRDPRGEQRLDLAWGLYTNRRIDEELMRILSSHLPAEESDTEVKNAAATRHARLGKAPPRD